MDSTFLTTSLIWGIIYIIVFLFPLFYYIHRFFFKKNFQGEEINPIQVVFTGLILHILIATVLIVFAYILNALNVQNFSPCKGIRFFIFGISPTKSCSYVINVHNNIFWNVWYDIYKNASYNFSNPVEGSKKIIAGAIYSISVVMYFILNALLLMVIFYPFVVLYKSIFNKKSQPNETISIYNVAFKTIISAVALYFVLYMHFIIDTNLTTNICNVTGFDAFSLAKSALRELLGVNK